MKNCQTVQRQRIIFFFVVICFLALLLLFRLSYLMFCKADSYGEKAKQVQQRERQIKAERGRILDRNGVILAGNKPVSTISVIHSQIKEPEKVIHVLSEYLDMDEEKVAKLVKKRSSREKIKSNVDKEISDKIRNMGIAGIVIDEDYKRYYPYGKLGSKVIGFAGGDNQGIIGLEVFYDDMLAGKNGTIYTTTNAKGIEIEGKTEEREEPVPGKDLYTSIDINIQKYAMQAAWKVKKAKKAKSVRIIMLNPQNGEIYAMVNLPEFNLNDPYKLANSDNLSEKEKQEKLNQTWRNGCISDTYEPGSTFKIITATAALEENVVKETDRFYCPGYKIVEDRRIRCHKVKGHGSENFVEGVQNSCNPVFIEVGARVGVENFFRYIDKLGLMDKTGVDLPGEAVTIMHKKENVGAVELATMSFGQSFQLSPLRLMTTVSAIINGGTQITPHFGVSLSDIHETEIQKLSYDEGERIVSEETSKKMQVILESVVSEGSGSKATVKGYKVGAKTGTSQKLPRSSHKYIASTLGFAPADDPQIMALVLIDEPQGIYYGGQIAAPVISELLKNALPYLEREKE